MEDYKNTNVEVKSNNSARGYQIVVILLVIILAVLAFLYFRQAKNLKAETEQVRTELQSQIASVRSEMDKLEVTNRGLRVDIQTEKDRADSLLNALQNERNVSRATIRKYEAELGTLKSVMRRYVTQIDSLNSVNQNLAAENVVNKNKADAADMRARRAEERNNELAKMVQQGAAVRASNIDIYALNSNEKVVERASRAAFLRIDFVLNANGLTKAGERKVYARVTAPDGYVLAADGNSQFTYEGRQITYSAMREVDYQNEDLAVGLYYNGKLVSGAYTVELYMDGFKIGQSEVLLK